MKFAEESNASWESGGLPCLRWSAQLQLRSRPWEHTSQDLPVSMVAVGFQQVS